MRQGSGNGEWEAWMMAAQAGDARAYDRLLRDVLPLLRGIACRRIADAAEAEDAVQDTLLTLHRLRHAWNPTRPLRPWLATLCERRCIDRLRAKGRLSQRVIALDVLPEGAAVEAPQAPAELAAAELRRVVAALPRVQRLAITFAKLADMPVAEAAARSGMTPGGLKVATHRAIRSLRRQLAPELA